MKGPLPQLLYLLAVEKRKEPQFQRIRWDELLAFANDHWLTPALHGALLRNGYLPIIPAEVSSYTEHLARANQRRNSMLRSQAFELAQILNSVGITPTFLKGAADLLEAAPILSTDGIVGDIDLLVPADHGALAAGALARHGYQPTGAPTPNLHTYVDLSRPHDAAMVDLHVRPLKMSGLLTSADLMDQATIISTPRGNFALPSPTMRFHHRVLHEQIQDGQLLSGRIKLCNTWRSAWILRQHQREMDWQNLTVGLPNSLQRAALEVEAHAVRMFGARIPIRAGIRSRVAHGWRMMRVRNPGIEVPAGPVALSLARYFWKYRYNTNHSRESATNPADQTTNGFQQPCTQMPSTATQLSLWSTSTAKTSD